MNWYKKAKDIFPELNELYDKLKSQVSNCLLNKNKCVIDDITIVLVDGDKVKTEYNMDFIEGGNDAVYNFIPSNTIWIDKDLESHEYPFIILHEFIERYLMKKYGMEYEMAHSIANKFEESARTHS